MALTNHKFLLAARPVGMPKHTDWTYVEEPVGKPKEGEFLVQTLTTPSILPCAGGSMTCGPMSRRLESEN